MFLLGFIVTLYSSGSNWQIFGIGLIFPGAGFLSYAGFDSMNEMMHIAMAFGGFSIFCISIILWFGTGNVLAPMITWISLAYVASLFDEGFVYEYSLALTMLIWILCFAFIGVIALVKRIIGVRKRAKANLYLQENADKVTSGFTTKDAEIKPYDLEDIRRLRFLLDRALQPLDKFNGFDVIDQFQTSALRYQISFIGYALSMAQSNKLSAFTGYLSYAQKKLIDKQKEPKVWKYWGLENLWGNFSLDKNPMAKNNIMYTGFCTTQMAMYHNATGRSEFNIEGSFTLKAKSGKEYKNDLNYMVATLGNNMDSSPFVLAPCEPNWIYPLCNSITAIGVKSHSPELWQKSEDSFRESFEKYFMNLKGNIIACRSSYTGLAFPQIGGAMPQALPCFFLNGLYPDIALRQWVLLRAEMLKDGKFNKKKFWRIDTGNYKFTRASAYTATALTAAEFGDWEIYDFCMQALEEELPTKVLKGKAYRPKVSVFSHAVEFFARNTNKNGFRDLMLKGKSEVLLNPHISKVTYPDVIVAKAVFVNDKLEATFYSEKALKIHEIIISGLQANRSYILQVDGNRSNITVDPDGSAQINLKINGFQDIMIEAGF